GDKARDGETALVDGHTVGVYNSLKGDFIWQANVRPAYAWYDGQVKRMTLNDTYATGEGTTAARINLGGPVATVADDSAKIFPFKRMLGKQAVDPTQRKVIVPHLFGTGGFWATIPAVYDEATVLANWTTSLTTGAKAAGQIADTDAYTGLDTGATPWSWAYTEMWMGINHEVALKGDTLGCTSCHGASTAEWDWAALGYTCDPMTGGAVACGSRHP
ncbi:MAG: hypothetical protein JRH20_28340, partial [Deltaproteobacteria bacterium]|nr:hypothetical protein [Deltaproteobacteria bacterium]